MNLSRTRSLCTEIYTIINNLTAQNAVAIFVLILVFSYFMIYQLGLLFLYVSILYLKGTLNCNIVYT